VAILKIIVTISIVIALITYLMRKWLERAWSSNKWKAVVLGFFMGAVIGIVIYYIERVWIKIHVVKPFNLMPYYLLPYWQYRRSKDKIISFFKGFKKVRTLYRKVFRKTWLSKIGS